MASGKRRHLSCHVSSGLDFLVCRQVEGKALAPGGRLPGLPTGGGTPGGSSFPKPLPQSSLSSSHLPPILCPGSAFGKILQELLFLFSATVSFVVDGGSGGAKPWGISRQIMDCFFPSLGHI